MRKASLVAQLRDFAPQAAGSRPKPRPDTLSHGDTMTTPSWDDAYAGDTPAPWDIGRPQPAFVRLADKGLLLGRLLDSGCGTGEQTLLAAPPGAGAMGLDVSVHPIE